VSSAMWMDDGGELKGKAVQMLGLVARIGKKVEERYDPTQLLVAFLTVGGPPKFNDAYVQG